jgi:hypothetical protein
MSLHLRSLPSEENMKLKPSMLLIPLLLLAPVPGRAGEPLTIPPEIAQNMKKGGKLDRLWVAPGFDGNQGFKLGQVSNETDELVGVVQDYFPHALRKLIKYESPYTLHLAIVSFKPKTSGDGHSSSRLEVEGRILDPAGKMAAAFTCFAMESIGGNVNDNSRLAVNKVAFAMAKDFMPSVLPSLDKSPAVIVAATAPALPSPAKGNAVPPVLEGTSAMLATPPDPAAPKVQLAGGSTVAATSTPAASAPLQAGSKGKEHEETPAPLIPLSILDKLKPGMELQSIWLSPAYDKAKGFSIGEVKYLVEARNDGIDKALPEALKEIGKPEAPCALELQIVELTLRSHTKGASNIGLGVEGRLITKDGTMVAAFKTRETITGSGDLVDDCWTAVRRLIRAMVRDLK